MLCGRFLAITLQWEDHAYRYIGAFVVELLRQHWQQAREEKFLARSFLNCVDDASVVLVSTQCVKSRHSHSPW